MGRRVVFIVYNLLIGFLFVFRYWWIGCIAIVCTHKLLFVGGDKAENIRILSVVVSGGFCSVSGGKIKQVLGLFLSLSIFTCVRVGSMGGWALGNACPL